MAVTYVKDFSFPSDFGFHKNGSASVPGKAKGGSSTPMRYREGGKVGQSKQAGHAKQQPSVAKSGVGSSDLKRTSSSDKGPTKTTREKSSGVQLPAFKHGGGCGCKMCGGGMVKKADGGTVAAGKVKDGDKKPWNPNDAVSPGSYKRTPPGQGEKNKSAASDRFAAKDDEPATKQVGDVERMSGFSDFKKGGKVHNRLANLGKYAHGGKVGAKYEKAAGTPKVKDEPRTETKSGKATGKHTAPAAGTRKTNGAAPRGDVKLAGGGLTRATSRKRNAAIHAKEHKPNGAALGALAAAIGGAGPAGAAKQPGMGGPTPPGMAPGMGSPPGGQMGGMAPPPGGAMGPGGMSHGGGVRHVVIHHIKHG